MYSPQKVLFGELLKCDREEAVRLLADAMLAESKQNDDWDCILRLIEKNLTSDSDEELANSEWVDDIDFNKLVGE